MTEEAEDQPWFQEMVRLREKVKALEAALARMTEDRDRWSGSAARLEVTLDGVTVTMREGPAARISQLESKITRLEKIEAAARELRSTLPCGRPWTKQETEIVIVLAAEKEGDK